MSYNSENAGWLCFDVETVALSDAATYDTEPIEAPGNYTKPEAIEGYIKKERQRRTARAALNIDLACIVMIGWQSDASPESRLLQANDSDAERAALTLFWEEVRAATRLVGFNNLRFDLPMLLRRSLYLDVPTPGIEVSRHNRQIVDLYQRLSFDGLVDGHSLAFYCRRFGIPSDDTVSGKDIGALVAAGEWAKVEHHCRCDVQQTVTLAQRLGLIGARARRAGF